MLCRAHPNLRQVNNVPIPSLTTDIWTFFKAYQGYIKLKTLNGEKITPETQYTYVKTQLLSFDRSTFQDILHMCDGTLRYGLQSIHVHSPHPPMGFVAWPSNMLGALVVFLGYSALALGILY